MSKKSQLFKKLPTEKLTLKLLSYFGLNDFNDSHYFSRKDLIRLNTVQKIIDITPELREYYINCKAKTYLNEITPKSAITILRQIIKVHNYNITSKEKYSNKEKFLVYSIVPLKTAEYKPVKINFD